MSVIPVLVKREFTSRVKGTAYILTTVIGVLVFVGLSFLPPIMERISSSFTPKTIELVVLDSQAESSLLPFFKALSADREGLTIRDASGLDEREAYRMVLEEGLAGLLLIDGPLCTLVTPDSKNMVLNDEIRSLVNQAATRWKAAELGLTQEEMNSLFQAVDFRIREVAPEQDGATEVDGIAQTQSMVLAYFLLFMIYMALILYGNMVASGVAEEKSSRIMEVMVSTVKPLELMFGKIIGVGALGLVQFIIWIGTGLIMAAMGRTGFLGGMLGVEASLSTLPLESILWFGLFFLLGYFFYASIFAAAGALVSRVEEVSQVVSLLMMFIVAGFLAAYISFLNPNSSFAVAASLIPFTAPMVMFARIMLADPPIIEAAASVVIMLLSIVLGTWISSKIYSIGILLYGKRPSIRQVARLLKG
ncbi:MAG TPA: ABC transporter permease [Firmicutes bacterium]|jgi:ABC-2 type transport system permease protein|nr:ABC transporter permease [Bacillota bacterium]HHT43036.1 ABC transporter permease [Bacillota bacterium]